MLVGIVRAKWEVAGQKALTHVTRLHPPFPRVQGNNTGFWGRGLVEHGGPWGPNHARAQSRSAHLGSEVDVNYL